MSQNFNDKEQFIEPVKLSGKPTGPFPYLISLQPLIRRHQILNPHPIIMNRFQKNILQSMKKGAQLLFDIEAKRGLLYSFKKGVEHLAELSIRSLSMMVKEGLLRVLKREGRIIHYALGPSA